MIKKTTSSVIYLLLTIAISGCDYVEDVSKSRLEKNTLDGVISCINNNKHKEEILGSEFIQEKCLEKHERESNERFTEGCTALAEVTPKVATLRLSSQTCRNLTDNIITSVKTYILIENFPVQSTNEINRTTSKYIFSTTESLKVLPGKSFNFMTNSELEDELKEVIVKDLPWCSDLEDSKKEPCVSWGISSHKYVSPNI